MRLDCHTSELLFRHYAGRARLAPDHARPALEFQAALFDEARTMSQERAGQFFRLMNGLEDRFPGTAGKLLAGSPQGPSPRMTLPAGLTFPQWPVGAATMLSDGNGTATIRIQGFMGFGFPLEDILRQIESARTVNLWINSPGGYAVAALTLCRALRGKAVSVTMAKAHSAGILLAQAGNVRRVESTASLMVHPIHGCILGTADELRSEANYIRSLNGEAKQLFHRCDPAAVEQWFSAGEHYFTAEEAVAAGLADEVIEPQRAHAGNGGQQQETGTDSMLLSLGSELLARLRANFKEPGQFKAMLQKSLEAV